MPQSANRRRHTITRGKTYLKFLLVAGQTESQVAFEKVGPPIRLSKEIECLLNFFYKVIPQER